MDNLMSVKFHSLTWLGSNRTRTWGQKFTLQIQVSFPLNLPWMEGEQSNQMIFAIPNELLKQDMSSYLQAFHSH